MATKKEPAVKVTKVKATTGSTSTATEVSAELKVEAPKPSLFEDLARLQERVQAEWTEYPDVVRSTLQNVDSAIDQVLQADRTWKHLQREDA